MSSQRTYPRPTSLETLHLTDAPVLDELELVSWHETDAATWSRRVLKSEQERILKPILGKYPKLPEGLLAAGTDSLVIGLTRDGLMYEDGEWVENDEMWGATVKLSADDVAFVARAFQEGCESVLFRPYFPLAWITQPPYLAAGKPSAISKLPGKSKLIAIVDDLDKSAVLELIALAPGPVLYRRHDGKWFEDDQWLVPLRSIDPPAVVVLSETDLQNDVISQVDESTKGVDFEPKIIKQKKLRSSAFQNLDDRLGKLEEQSILAVAKSVEGIKGTEKLRQYWTVGEGGLMKIRWGTPGSWTRCHRHLTKYIGPRANGYCTNLCQRMGGFGVACHVGVKGDAAPLIGVATYTSDMFKLKPRKKTGSGKTPYARKERKTTRELTDAEIEQRREAARKSAMARRKTATDSRSDDFKKAPLEQKVQIAAQLEQEAQARVKELEAQLRATEDDRVKAQVQGELDDLRDMLSAKDEWLRNARYNEVKLADKNIKAASKQIDSVRDGYNRTVDSLRNQRDSIDIQIEAARGVEDQNAASRAGARAKNTAARERIEGEAREMRARAAELRSRAKYAGSATQRIEFENAARELSEGAAERVAAIEKFVEATAGQGLTRVEQLQKQRRELTRKITSVGNQKTHKLTEMQRNLKSMREKRSDLVERYSTASEYLRKRRATQRPGQFFV